MAFEFPTDLAIPPPQALKNLSASQHKLYTLCERKWAFSYIHGIRSPKTQALDLGTALHKQIEDFYLKNETPKANLAQEALKVLPVKGSGLIAIEKPMEEPGVIVAGLPWLGYIDLLYQRFGDTKNVSIYDHKSTKSLGWALMPAQLKDDVQLMTYAHWASKADAQVELFNLFHTYLVTTTERQISQVPATVDRAHVEKAWLPIEAKGREMVQVAKSGTTWETSVPNYSSCGAFGGCPFRLICDEHKRKSNPGGGVFAAPTFQPEAPKEGRMALSDRMKSTAATTAASAAPTTPAAPPVNTAPATPAANVAANVAKVEATGVLPPDAPAQGPGAPPPPAAPPAAEPAKRGPGRPRRLHITDVPAADAPATSTSNAGSSTAPAANTATVTTPAATSTPTPATKAEPTTKGPGFILCIDALPMPGAPGNVAPLEVILGNLAQKVAEQRGVASIFNLTFNEPRAALGAALKAYPFGADIYTFNGTGMFREVVLEVMAPIARMVIFGSR